MRSIDDVKEILKDWVAEGRAAKANYLLIALDKLTGKYYPHYVFGDDIDEAWDSFLDKNGKNSQALISFDLNKKVLGVDNASES